MTSTGIDTTVAVIGGGVVGAAVLFELAHRGVEAVLLEIDDDLGYAASGTNSGILHTGFDSKPGELETALILRAAARRPAVLDALGVPVLHCGARLRPHSDEDRATVEGLAANARANGVDIRLQPDGTLEVPGESITDPAAYTLALAAAAVRRGAHVRTGAAVTGIDRVPDGLTVHLADGGRITCRAAVNCAGLHADDVARLVGDDSFEIYPRKGEFFLFRLPDGRRLDQILLPVPTPRTKGVLVFPTLDGMVAAGPTAVDLTDKRDWTVRPQALDEIRPKAVAMLPDLDGLDPVGSYAGLRPAGRGVNYVIGPSRSCPQLVNVAAIRSTGLTASLGIADRVARDLADVGVAVGEYVPPDRVEPTEPDESRRAAVPWWQRAAQRHRV